MFPTPRSSPASDNNLTIGVMLPSDFDPRNLLKAARLAETNGFAELWLAEDRGYGGGFSMAATALSATDKLRIGLGILPAPVRNPVFLAMEIATLCNLYPTRFIPAIGHGWPPWMDEIGAKFSHPIIALEEIYLATRSLLRGQSVTVDGKYVKLDNIALARPPNYLPSILIGVSRHNSLKLSGRISDGTILPEGSSPEYVTGVSKLLSEGTFRPRLAPHSIRVISWCDITDNIVDGCERLRPFVKSFLDAGALGPQLEALGLAQLHCQRESRTTELDDSVIRRLAIIGNPKQCSDQISRLVNAGANGIIVRATNYSTHVTLMKRMKPLLSILEWHQ